MDEIDIDLIKDQIRHCIYGPFPPAAINRVKGISETLRVTKTISEEDQKFLNELEKKLEEDDGE